MDKFLALPNQAGVEELEKCGEATCDSSLGKEGAEERTFSFLKGKNANKMEGTKF